jgi:hypothetical protein
MKKKGKCRLPPDIPEQFVLPCVRSCRGSVAIILQQDVAIATAREKKKTGPDMIRASAKV